MDIGAAALSYIGRENDGAHVYESDPRSTCGAALHSVRRLETCSALQFVTVSDSLWMDGESGFYLNA